MLTIPTKFYVDSMDRGLPVPFDYADSTRHCRIKADDPNLPTLISDAKFYANPWGPDRVPHIRQAAKALLASLEQQGIEV